jgi:hypothetical protein
MFEILLSSVYILDNGLEGWGMGFWIYRGFLVGGGFLWMELNERINMRFSFNNIKLMKYDRDRGSRMTRQ